MNSLELALAIRKHAIVMTNLGKSSHVGSVLSIADILAVLYSEVLKVNPAEPKWEGRDRFILSKGHAGAGVYAALAETGFFSPKVLSTHCQDGSTLSGHISHKLNPGVEFSTGSLGHGLSVSAGIALSLLYKKSKSRVFCLMSDGECDEGTTWECALLANQYQLSNLVVIIDRNLIQSLDSTESVLALEPLAAKWTSFNWNVLEIDGHSHEELFSALSDTKGPLCIIANTTKGKGVSFMEGKVLWHYKSPTDEEYADALREIQG
jgi:transketolase